MQDRFSIISLRYLAELIRRQLDTGYYFGIPEELFYKGNSSLRPVMRFGHRLELPLGVAAGPHTQLAQNIIGAWLCGARYMELKTIQKLDDLNVSKPCIDMQDEGYNCEWSQELKLDESFDQYLNAWILIHILNKQIFGTDKETATIFNMSVGYDLEGIRGEKVSRFLDKMNDCSVEKAARLKEIEDIFPGAASVNIPDKISDNVTLSTMHGCPADEIEEIAKYLIERRHLHTVIKLNPTLLGPEKLRDILNVKLGFRTVVPDEAFKHDLKYSDATGMIRRLSVTAEKEKLFFGVKLTNTLESVNKGTVLPAVESMNYMSGRALHPLSVMLAYDLQKEFSGKLDISFSAGADCFNIGNLLSCGLSTVTVCSDLLKPGGYGKLRQYINEAEKNLYYTDDDAKRLEMLGEYSLKVLSDVYYQRKRIKPDIKTSRTLAYFDCIYAPCVNTCPSNQEIPSYLRYVAEGNNNKAIQVILSTNPFPSVTGSVCDHLCQTKCTRVHYDDAIHIRDIKYYVSKNHSIEEVPVPAEHNGIKIAIAGAGPSGLACAWFLKLAGCEVTVYEEKEKPGGMPASVIPAFRLSKEDLEKDIQRIISTGIKIHCNTIVDRAFFEQIKEGNNYVYISVGAKHSKKLNIPGSQMHGVYDPLKFLEEIKNGKRNITAKNILIIGGGNTAIDAARAAKRVAGDNALVKIIYRRSVEDMPAALEETDTALNEGIKIEEWITPVEIIGEEGIVTAVKCCKNKAGENDESGRPKPVTIPGSEFIIPADIVIPALGQDVVADFMSDDKITFDPDNEIYSSGNVFIGGDARRGASSIIKAIADGRKTAAYILRQSGIANKENNNKYEHNIRNILIKKAIRRNTGKFENNHNYEAESAKHEASACLECDVICNNCVSVCPNFANFSYKTNIVGYKLFKAVRTVDGFSLKESGFFRIDQSYQVLHIEDFCNNCGNCMTFCPTNSAPYKEKPGLFLTEAAFENADKGFLLKVINNKNTLCMKDVSGFNFLTDDNDTWIFETLDYRAVLTKADLLPADIIWKSETAKEALFENAGIMSVIFGAAVNLKR